MKTKKMLMAMIAMVLVAFATMYISGCSHNVDSQIPVNEFTQAPANSMKFVGNVGFKSEDQVSVGYNARSFFIKKSDFGVIKQAKDLSLSGKPATVYTITDVSSEGMTGSRIVFIDESFTPDIQKYQEWVKENSVPKNARKQSTLGVSWPSYTLVANAFNYLKTFNCTGIGYSSCIPFRYIRDGSYARAHKMKQLMGLQYGYSCNKIFSIGKLMAKSSTYNCCVGWDYHVAPLVYVGSTQYVLDPSMFNGLVSPSTWLAAQTNSANCGGSPYGSTVIKTGNIYAYNSLNGGYGTDDLYSDTNYTIAAFAGYLGCAPGTCKLA